MDIHHVHDAPLDWWFSFPEGSLPSRIKEVIVITSGFPCDLAPEYFIAHSNKRYNGIVLDSLNLQAVHRHPESLAWQIDWGACVLLSCFASDSGLGFVKAVPFHYGLCRTGPLHHQLWKDWHKHIYLLAGIVNSYRGAGSMDIYL